MAVVSVLVIIAVPTYFYFIDRARIVTSMSALETVRMEMESYHIDSGKYPSSINFDNFTDEKGNFVVSRQEWNVIKDKIFKFFYYSLTPDGYVIKAKAIDSNHTTITATPQSISQ